MPDADPRPARAAAAAHADRALHPRRRTGRLADAGAARRPRRQPGDDPQHPRRPGGRRPADLAAHLGRAHARRRRAIACSSTRCCRCGRCRRANWRGCAHELPAGSGTQALLGSASELLSAMTHFVGVVSVPQARAVRVPPHRFRAAGRAARAGDPGVRRQRRAEPHHPDAPRLRRRRTGARRQLPQPALRRPAAGRDPRDAGARAAGPRAARWKPCSRTRSNWPSRRCVPGGGDDVLLAGQTRLMGVQELSDLDRLRDLFEAFARKREILQLLERTDRARRACASSSARKPGWRRWKASRWSPRPTAAGGQVLGVLGRDRPDPDGLRAGDPGGAGRGRRPRRRPGRRLSRPESAPGGLKAPAAAACAAVRVARTPPMTNEPMHDPRTTRRTPTPHRRGRAVAAGPDRSPQGRTRTTPRRGAARTRRPRQPAQAPRPRHRAGPQVRQRTPAERTAAAVRQHGSRPGRRRAGRPAARGPGADPAPAAPHRREQRPGRSRPGSRATPSTPNATRR